jgi:PAS domain S-box-containing protein
MAGPTDTEKLHELIEAQETLRAIRNGEVDAFVCETKGGYRIETLTGAEMPYRFLADAMREGALTVARDGTILYCNRRYAAMVGCDYTEIVGRNATQWLVLHTALDDALAAAQRGEVHLDATLRSVGGLIPASVTACALVTEGADTIYCLVVSDVSDRVVAEHLRVAQAKLSRQHAELAAIYDCLPYAVVVAEGDDRLGYQNPTARTLLSRHPELELHARAAGTAALASGGETSEITLRGHDRRESSFRLHAKLLLVEGRTPRAVVVIDDVSDEREAARARERQEQLRELFVGILGHDLRSPLAAIATSAALIRHAPDHERRTRAVEVIERSTHRMKRLVDDMLDLTVSRIGGGIPVETAPTNLADVVRSAIDELTTTRPDARFDIHVEGDTRGLWDAARLGQVATNLLTNAVEHGAAERPIRVRLEGREDARVVLAVQNEGPPIPAETLPTVFDPFRRGGERTPKRAQNAGLGLYIAERIVTAHGGTIAVGSTEGEGTTFTVTLPRQARTSTPASIPPP